MDTISEDEGTSYWVCKGCLRACDAYVERKPVIPKRELFNTLYADVLRGKFGTKNRAELLQRLQEIRKIE